MRVIVHTDDLTDMILATRCVKACIANEHERCIYTYGDTAVYAKLNKSGSWSVWVTTDRSPTELGEILERPSE